MAITPNIVTIDGDGGGILLTSDVSGVWSSNVGDLYTDAGFTLLYDGATSRTTIYFKPFNLTSDGVVMCGGAEAAVTVRGVLPDFPHYPMEWTADKRGIIPSVSRTGRIRGRIIGDGEMMRDYKLVYDRRTPEAVEEFERFHHHHYPNRTFIYRNYWSGIDGMFAFDSPLKGSANSRRSGKVDVAIKQVPYDVANELAALRLLDRVQSVGVWAAYGFDRLFRRYRGPVFSVEDDDGFVKDIGLDSNGEMALDQLTGAGPYLVRRWYDQSGNGRHLYNDDADAPTLDATERAVHFDDKVLYFPPTNSLAAGEIFIKLKMASNPPGDGLGSIWTLGNAGASTHYYYHGDDQIYQDLLSQTRHVIPIGEHDVAEWHVMSAYSQTDERATYINNQLVGSVGKVNTVGHATLPRLGQGVSEGHYMVGDVRSLVIVTGKVLPSERALVHANL